MEDKKLDEIKEYVKNLDSNISLSWDEWIGDDDNYFLNHFSPDFKMALDFVEEILDDPGSSYNNKEENND